MLTAHFFARDFGRRMSDRLGNVQNPIETSDYANVALSRAGAQGALSLSSSGQVNPRDHFASLIMSLNSLTGLLPSNIETGFDSRGLWRL